MSNRFGSPRSIAFIASLVLLVSCTSRIRCATPDARFEGTYRSEFDDVFAFLIRSRIEGRESPPAALALLGPGVEIGALELEATMRFRLVVDVPGVHFHQALHGTWNSTSEGIELRANSISEKLTIVRDADRLVLRGLRANEPRLSQLFTLGIPFHQVERAAGGDTR